MRPSARVEAIRRRRGAAALAFGIMLAGTGAQAEPLSLATPQAVTDFAQELRAYAGATTVRWTLAASSEAAATALIGALGGRLGASGADLLDRIDVEILPEAELPGGPAAWIAPDAALVAAPSCSWQVWVTDPAAPSEGADPVTLPLAPGDAVPVTEDATFRVGFTGLLQSTLYAFGETLPGQVRDLAAAPDLDIPVDAGNMTEILVLVRARAPVPFLDRLRAALTDAAGSRQAVDPELALRTNLLGSARGIGANIQLVSPDMVVGTHAGGTARPDPTNLAETCVYSLVPASIG